jgi:predicted oxidoreductase
MKKMTLGKTNLHVPAIAVGCMHINTVDRNTASAVLKTALSSGLNFFDTADCYEWGKAETAFAEILKLNEDDREKVYIQTKCGIRPNSFDFSKEHILEAVDASLKRMNTDYIDVLLLHRPDALVEPEEVAEAFSLLVERGKVHYFGVSNQDPYLIQLLQQYIKQPVAVNQLQFSMTNATMITQTLNMNMLDDMAIDRDNGVLNFCRLKGITVQAWSPFQHGFFSGAFLNNPDFPELNAKINEIAEKYNVPNSAIPLAWILRHPARIQPVTGTMNPKHLEDSVRAFDVELTREEWYGLYLAAGHRLP